MTAWFGAREVKKADEKDNKEGKNEEKSVSFYVFLGRERKSKLMIIDMLRRSPRDEEMLECIVCREEGRRG